MRNIFDQYSSSNLENRVTHAFAHALASHRGVRRNLVSRITGLNDVRDLDVSVQDRTNGESIPDLVLRDGDQPVCAFEHKIVPNAVRTEQIQAHLAKVSTADPALARVVVTTPDLDEPIPVRLVKQVGVNSVWLPWSEVYQLAKPVTTARGGSSLVAAFCDYLRVVETSLQIKGTDVMLTAFDGICFEDGTRVDHQATSLLTHLRRYLASSEAAKETFPDLNTELGRHRMSGPWTSIGLVPVPEGSEPEAFNKHPHLTLDFDDKQFAMFIVLPNAAYNEYHQRARKASPDSWKQVLLETRKEVAQIYQTGRGRIDRGRQGMAPTPFMNITQRHWLTRSGPVVEDGVMRFSLDIVSGSDGNKVDEKVKDVEVWLSIIPELVKASRRANFEFQLGLAYPYDRCHDLLCTHKFPEDLAWSLRALRPFFNLLTED